LTEDDLVGLVVSRTPTPDPDTTPTFTYPPGTYWGAVYSVTGEKTGIAFMNNDEYRVVVQPVGATVPELTPTPQGRTARLACPSKGSNSKKRVRKKLTKHRYIGIPRPSWGSAVRGGRGDDVDALRKLEKAKRTGKRARLYVGSIAPLRRPWPWKPLLSLMPPLAPSDSPPASPTASESSAPEDDDRDEGEEPGEGEWPSEYVLADIQDGLAGEAGAAAPGSAHFLAVPDDTLAGIIKLALAAVSGCA
jgi:hypothetical protein